MNKICTIRNEDVNKILVGVQKGHKHLRISIKLKNELVLIFQEATVANILRVYTTVKRHASIRAQELEKRKLMADLRKDGYAVHQLLETPKKNEEVERELKELLEMGELSN